MYKYGKPTKTTLLINASMEGETIETKVERITANKEGIKDGAPLVYTERKDGVPAGYNIRTDRFEIAVEAMNAVTKNNVAKRENQAKMEIVKDGGAEPIHATDGTNQ